MELMGQRVRLCPLDRSHVTNTFEWVNNSDLGRTMDRARPVSEFEHEEWFKRLVTRQDCMYWAIENLERREHIGNVWLWDIDCRHRKAEVRIVLGRSRGKGMGSEAIRLVTLHAFKTLNLHKLYAYVRSINPRGVRAFEQASFVVEGVLKSDRWVDELYVDVHLLGRVRDDELSSTN